MRLKLLTIFLSFSFPFFCQAESLTATFAGGCFWCIESAFDDKPGVLFAISGYSGGTKQNAVYKLVGSGQTKHYEAVQVTYDSTKTNYKALLEIFWRSINPTDSQGQFADKGPQYKTAIFFRDVEQKRLATESKQILGKDKIFRRKIVVPIIKLKNFFPAEDYHQDYHKKSKLRYKAYYYGSGRGTYLSDKWADKKDYKIFK